MPVSSNSKEMMHSLVSIWGARRRDWACAGADPLRDVGRVSACGSKAARIASSGPVWLCARSVSARLISTVPTVDSVCAVPPPPFISMKSR